MKVAIKNILNIASILAKNGVDLKNLQIKKTIDGKSRYILLKEIEQEGIDIKKIIDENHLDGELCLGMKIMSLRQIYNGTVKQKITEQERKQAENLGLIRKKKIDELLYIANVLYEEKVVLSAIRLGDNSHRNILLKDIKQDGIDIEKIIRQYNLNGEFKWGQNISNLRSMYKENKLTEQQIAEAEKLDLLDNKTLIDRVLETARILKNNGVELDRFPISKVVNGRQTEILLEDIKQPGINMQEIIKENRLDRKFKWGKNVTILRRAYNSQQLTEKQMHEVEELHLNRTKTVVDEILEVARILKNNGVNLQDIPKRKDKKNILLKDIKQDGIDMKKIIRDNKLDGNFKWGDKIIRLRATYIGKTSSYQITEENMREIKKLGLFEDKESGISRILNVVKALHENGLDFKKMVLSKYVDRKQRYILLKDVKQDGINIDEIIEKTGLNEEYPLGRNLLHLRKAYSGNEHYKITDEDKKEIERLGIIDPLRNKEEIKRDLLKKEKESEQLYKEYQKLANKDKNLEEGE